MTKIAIIIHTTYGHIATMAESVKKGVEASGAECTIFQVAKPNQKDKLLPVILANMGAPPIPEYPVIVAAQMVEFDGFLFGLSSRFGIMPTEIKTFMDSTGRIWHNGSLVGKPGGCFFSTGSQGGGQETVGLTTITFFAYMGMPFVPMGYIDPKALNMDEIHGASPYGCGTFAGVKGSRQPSELEKDLAVSHGKHFGLIAAKLAK